MWHKYLKIARIESGAAPSEPKKDANNGVQNAELGIDISHSIDDHTLNCSKNTG